MLTAPQHSFLAWGLVRNISIKSPLPLFLPPTPTCPAEGFQRLEQADDPDSFHTFPQELQQLLGPIAWQLPPVLLAAATSSSNGGGGGSSGTRSAGDNQQTGFGLGDAALAALHNWCRVAIATYNAQHTAARAAGRLAELSALQEKMAGWVSDSIGYVLLLLSGRQPYWWPLLPVLLLLSMPGNVLVLLLRVTLPLSLAFCQSDWA